MIIMMFFIAYAYQYDTKNCREMINDLPLIACTVCNEMTQQAFSPGISNNLTFKEIPNMEGG
jgi:hypothetical protein